VEPLRAAFLTDDDGGGLWGWQVEFKGSDVDLIFGEAGGVGEVGGTLHPGGVEAAVAAG